MTASAPLRLALLVAATLAAFAGNSLLCRAALGQDHVDPATFTLVRLASGALLLALLVRRGPPVERTWSRVDAARAALLFAYAALFSWAYERIPASIGALVLFGSVQVSMLAWAMRSGAGPRGLQAVGATLAFAGLVALTVPGSGRPDLWGVLRMAGSGVAWGAYSLLGRAVREPVRATAAAFVGSVPLAALVAGGAALLHGLRADTTGLLLAVGSGAVASALGYVLWYSVLPALGAVRAAVVQLAVPVVTAIGGTALLGEPIPLRLVLSGAVVLGGIALAIRPARRP